MRILLAGATGAIGRPLVGLLGDAGHHVIAMSRSAARAAASGAPEHVAADALDGGAVRRAVLEAEPELIIHQLTAIPQRIDPKRVAEQFALTNRLREEGTRNLIAAAPGVRLIAQSISFAYRPGPPGGLHREDDPLFIDAPGSWGRTVQAIASLEQQVLATGGVVLRYGYFHGPGTAYAPDGWMAQDLHRRRLPIVGSGRNRWSFIHVDDAARATAAAIAHPAAATFNVVDDHPLALSEWLPRFARSVGAPRPFRVPTWVARIVAGQQAARTMSSDQAAANDAARQALSWAPQQQPAFAL